MDSLKFAFDTLIIGALALPWLWIFIRMFFHAGSNEQRIRFPMLDTLDEDTRKVIASVMILAVGYLLGSAISRISSDFFDDDEVFRKALPTVGTIRQGVYLHQYCDQHSVLDQIYTPGRLIELADGKKILCTDAPVMDELVAEFFSQQEGKLLLGGDDKLGRLHEYHDQIEILRGATLNAGILFTLSLFGLFALYRSRLPPGKLRLLLKGVLYVPAVICLVGGSLLMWQHFNRPEMPAIPQKSTTLQPANTDESTRHVPMVNPYELHADPPLAEALIILLGIGGFCLQLTEDNPRLYRNVCVVAMVLTVVSYGSWWWTEVLYDQQVIHSFPS